MSAEVLSHTLPEGGRVAVEYDTDPGSPRSWDNLGTLALLDRCRYCFGDEALPRDEVLALLRRPDLIALPVYIYDHSGITINTTGFSCPWDSGMVGVIYVSRDAVRREWNKKAISPKLLDQVRKSLRGEIAVLDQYLTGQVYGFRVYDPEGEEVDSCWGFYGEPEECLVEGLAAAEHCAV
jgi:hypothetical protein